MRMYWPGRVGAPAAARLDDQADGVAGFGVDRDDPAAQLRAGAQRVDDVEVVGGDQRRGDPLGELKEPVAQRAHRGGPGCCCCHKTTIP